MLSASPSTEMLQLQRHVHIQVVKKVCQTTYSSEHKVYGLVMSCISPESKRIAFLYLKVTRLHSEGDIYS